MNAINSGGVLLGLNFKLSPNLGIFADLIEGLT